MVHCLKAYELGPWYTALFARKKTWAESSYLIFHFQLFWIGFWFLFLKVASYFKNSDQSLLEVLSKSEFSWGPFNCVSFYSELLSWRLKFLFFFFPPALSFWCTFFNIKNLFWENCRFTWSYTVIQRDPMYYLLNGNI